MFFNSCDNSSGPPRVLVFSKTAGYRHASIPKGQEAIRKVGEQNGFLVDTTEDASLINEENLQQYAAGSPEGPVLDSWKNEGSRAKKERLHLESSLDKEARVAADQPFYLVSKLLAPGTEQGRVAFGGVGVLQK